MDKVVKQIAATDPNAVDRLGLLAHQMFGGKRMLRHRTNYSNPHVNALVRLLNYNQPEGQENVPKAMAEQISLAGRTTRTMKPYKSTETVHDRLAEKRNPYDYFGNPKVKYKAIEDEPLTPYHTHEEVTANPEDWVDIEHGGGFQHIKDFVSGKSKGYSLDHSTMKGIFVSNMAHPRNKEVNRTPQYAGRATGFIDKPGKLTGRIKAKHLMSVRNAYEAGLTPESVKHIKNLKVESLTPDKALRKNMPWNVSLDKVAEQIRNKYNIQMHYGK
jgi:hypothetical protein